MERCKHANQTSHGHGSEALELRRQRIEHRKQHAIISLALDA
jgi:hypothetical protein